MTATLRDPESDRAGGLPVYHVCDDQLEMGASLGNAKCWVNTRGSGAIEQVFACDLGLVVYGGMAVRYSGASNRLVRPNLSEDEEVGRLAEERESFVQLRPDRPGVIDIHPCYGTIWCCRAILPFARQCLCPRRLGTNSRRSISWSTS